MPDPQAFAKRATHWRARVDAALERALPAAVESPQRLHAAMRHAALGGGKRMRPLLVYATGTAFGAEEAILDVPAAAVELIHAYSLAHDDLPAMDDDALRRGKQTVHVAFDEATAILAGDALQSLAYELLADAPVSVEARIAMLRELAIAAGARGMCGGQALDIAATGNGKRGQSEVSQEESRPGRDAGCEIHSDPFSLDALQRLHALKTGALLRAAVRLGAIAAGVDAQTHTRLDAFADALGLAFQVRDDLLDVEGDSATLGKTAGKDAAQAKATFPALLGIDASRTRLQQLAATMHDALAPLGERTEALAELGRQAIERAS
ncbi:MAG: polyprenyl synthetase family protein [Luteimonas sp.]